MSSMPLRLRRVEDAEVPRNLFVAEGLMYRVSLLSSRNFFTAAYLFRVSTPFNFGSFVIKNRKEYRE